jgi:putative Mn2+ efflux pump MntP
VFCNSDKVFNKSIECGEKPLNISYLLMVGIAKSIDALPVGVSFAFLNTDIVFPVVVIGIVTFSISVVGVYYGKKFGNRFEDKAEVIEGFILLGIGLKILIEDLFIT